MKHKKSLTDYIFPSYCLLIFIFKLTVNPTLTSNSWLCFLGAFCTILLMHLWRYSIYWGCRFWSDISYNSLLFLAAPALVWLYVDTLNSHNYSCDLFLVCGLCMCLLINFYSHNTFARTAMIGTLFCIVGLWLAINSNITIWGLLTICLVGFVYTPLIAQEFCCEENIKYNKVYISILLLVLDNYILGSQTGVACIGLNLIQYSSNSFGQAVLLFLLGYHQECIILLVGLIIICLSYNHLKQLLYLSNAFSALIWGYLVVERWNFLSCFIFTIVSFQLSSLFNSCQKSNIYRNKCST